MSKRIKKHTDKKINKNNLRVITLYKHIKNEQLGKTPPQKKKKNRKISSAYSVEGNLDKLDLHCIPPL